MNNTNNNNINKILSESGLSQNDISLLSNLMNGNLNKKLIDQSNTITGTTDWTRLYKVLNINETGILGVMMEVGLEGSGVMWVDGVNISKSVTDESVNVFLGSDGTNTLSYYSVDQEGNTEVQKSESIKIDHDFI